MSDWEFEEKDFVLITTAWGQLTSEQLRLVVQRANARLAEERAKCPLRAKLAECEKKLAEAKSVIAVGDPHNMVFD